MFVITMKDKMLITDPIIIKSIKPKPLEPNFSDVDGFCIIIVKLHHMPYYFSFRKKIYFSMYFCTFSIISYKEY